MIGMAAALAVVMVGAADSYVWPLDLPRVITSSFGEYRGGRFHAGLDLRTGDTGHEVKSPASGYVSRIRCSSWGYGKAVYLQLDDGHLAVFGHLNDFAPALRDYVRAAQHEAKSYTVDLTLNPEQFRVKAGEVVALSGDTGAGPAHLHYELRDKDERPFNPRLLGVSWPDQTAPLLNKIAVVPDGPHSLVNGGFKPALVECSPSGKDQYTCRPVRARGRVAIGVDLLDPANGGANKLGIYTLKTFADGQEVFALRLDAFSYDESRYETVAYHPFLKDSGRFLLQWRWPDNQCGIYPKSGDGWIEVREKPVEVRVEAADFMGNTASTSFVIESDREEETAVPALAATSNQKGMMQIQCAGMWLLVTAQFPDPEPVAPMLQVQGAPNACQFRRTDEKSFSAAIEPAPDADRLTISTTHERLNPSEPRVIHVFRRGAKAAVSDGVFKLEVDPESAYGILFVELSTDDTAPQELRLWPQDAPIDAPVTLSAPIPAGTTETSCLAFYRREGSRLRPLPTLARDGRLEAQAAQLGDYCVIEDDRPPVVSEFKIGAGAKRPAITAKVADETSGVMEVELTCNGAWLLTAYDPEADKVYWEQDQNLPPPPWTLVLTSTDHAGNKSTTEIVNKPAR